MHLLRKIRARKPLSTLAATIIGAVLPSLSFAQGLPTTAPPTRGNTDGNFIELLQNYAFDIAVFGGLALGTFALFVVCKNVLVSYAGIPDRTSTWGAVALNAVVGVLLLVLVVFLLTQAIEIL